MFYDNFIKSIYETEILPVIQKLPECIKWKFLIEQKYHNYTSGRYVFNKNRNCPSCFWNIKNDTLDLDNNSEEYSDGELIYTVKFHATLLNLKYLNRALQEENKNSIEKKEFDASDIMECIKNIQFPECQMDKINLFAMREDQISGKYEVIHSFNLL